MIKKIIKIFFGKRIYKGISKIFQIFLINKDFSYDKKRIIKGIYPSSNEGYVEKLKAEILFHTHSLEKGMSMRNTRDSFGAEKVEIILQRMKMYATFKGEDKFFVKMKNIVFAYRKSEFRNKSKDKDIDDFFGLYPSHMQARGWLEIDVQRDLFAFDHENARSFIRSRRSVRDFSGQLVNKEVIDQIIDLAQQCPSVCNRQGARVFVANTRQKIDYILSFQNGNSGFGEKIGAVFVVAFDINVLMNRAERNQGFVDGGIFAMALANAVHAIGLVSCFLNWSSTSKADKKFRENLGIGEDKLIITMLGIGYPLAKIIKIAASPRLELDEVSYWLN